MVRLSLRSFTVVVALALAACNNDSLPPAGQYASVSGTIVDHATNQPIAGATVTVDTVLSATTDAQGHFSIDKIPSGVLDYTVTANGYKAVSASGNAEPGKAFALNAALDSGP